MSTTTQPPDITAHLDAAERAAATLVEALRAALVAVPEGDTYSAPRYHLEEAIQRAQSVGSCDRVRAAMVEIARPKGPMVEVCYPSRHGTGSTGKEELAEVTSGSFVMRRGVRFSRKTGRKSDHTDRWTPCPYITEAERARVLALPRPPAPARPRAPKEPRP